MTYPNQLALRILTAGTLLLGATGVSTAADMSFAVTNNHSTAAEAAFYGEDSGTVWPGADTTYSFIKGETKTVTFSCQEGERICYGAWATGDTTTYWGVGQGNQHGCPYCCYTCSGGQTETFNLVQ
ncbi:hypothetical protein [Rhizobium sp. NRK18]|uniref:hypothetical protein n=1 Tax=Rhizobium sp. NRK18 TaxID=2964667 RepID=UPI0021C38443|nr:hypothetical protein [Rhizobium sp. NRK18]MCQ2005678.1 hypothetical protein [Rhizobium sp. NRK18]